MRLPAFFLCLIFLQTPILAIFFQKFRNSELSIEIQEIVELFSDSLENLREISNYAKDEMEQMIDQTWSPAENCDSFSARAEVGLRKSRWAGLGGASPRG